MPKMPEEEQKTMTSLLNRAFNAGTCDEAATALRVAFNFAQKHGDTIKDYIASQDELNIISKKSAGLETQLSEIDTYIQQMEAQLKSKDTTIADQNQTLREKDATIDDLQDQLDEKENRGGFTNINQNSSSFMQKVPNLLTKILWAAAATEAVALPVATSMTAGGASFLLGVLCVAQACITLALACNRKPGVSLTGRAFAKTLAKTAVGVGCCASLLLGAVGCCEMNGDATLIKNLSKDAMRQQKFDDPEVWKPGATFVANNQQPKTDRVGHEIKDEHEHTVFENIPDAVYKAKTVSVSDQASPTDLVPVQTAIVEIVSKRENCFTQEPKIVRGQVQVKRYDLNGKSVVELK